MIHLLLLCLQGRRTEIWRRRGGKSGGRFRLNQPATQGSDLSHGSLEEKGVADDFVDALPGHDSHAPRCEVEGADALVLQKMKQLGTVPMSRFPEEGLPRLCCMWSRRQVLEGVLALIPAGCMVKRWNSTPFDCFLITFQRLRVRTRRSPIFAYSSQILM